MSVTLIILVLLAILTGLIVYGTIVSHRWHRDHAGKEVIEETAHFYGHLFYYNPDDPRIFVPKRTGAGYTVNFSNPLSIITAMLVIGALSALAYFG